MAESKRKVIRLEGPRGYCVSEEEDKKVKEKDSNNEFFYFFSLSFQLGFAIAIPIVGGVLIGVWIDKYLSTSPKFTLLLSFLGVAVAFGSIINIIKSTRKK